MLSTEVTTYKTGGGTPTDKSMHPGEYGRVSAWIRKIKNDLVLNKDIYGHPPSIVFEIPAPQYIKVKVIDPTTIPGYDTSWERNLSSHSYIEAPDGTPTLRRHIDFSPPDINTATANAEADAVNTLSGMATPRTDGATPPTTYLTVVNPEYIPQPILLKIRRWVHHWILARIPEQHLHLVNDVVKGDIEDLLVKVYGLAAREPKRYCKVIKTRMKSNPLTFRNFDLMVHQWVLDQYEYFDIIQDAKCSADHKMPECDFVDHIIDSMEVYMPKFVDIYRQDEMPGQTWCSSILKKHLRHLASKGQLKIEKGAGQQNADNEIAANMIRQQQHETTSYGINDDSKHPYEHDQYWDE
jgi:hypothetical protein